ncbi:MAG: branched-chain amino acid ABC transporter permease [Ilumatobacteraceae bacterium]|jgi:branched-chain amino acid transport system permease protein
MTASLTTSNTQREPDGGESPARIAPGASVGRLMYPAFAAVIALVVLWIALTGSRHLIGVVTLALLFGAVATAWAIAGGLAGLFSLGHAAYFGMGAYATAYLYAEHDISPWFGLLAGVALSALLSVGTTWLSMRFKIRGSYFALVTLAWAEMLRLIVSNTDALGRSQGILVPFTREPTLADMQFLSPRSYLLLAGIYAVVAVALFALVKRSRFGWKLSAIRGDEQAAAATGIDVRRSLVITMAISAAATSVGGTLYVQYIQFIDPELAFSPTVSIDIAIRATIGGAMLALGPLLGAGVMEGLTEYLRTAMSDRPAMGLLLFGVAVIIVARYFQQGISGIGASIVRRIDRRRGAHK